MLPQCDPTSAFISSRGGRVQVALIHQVKSVGWTPGHLLQRLTEAMSLTCSFWTMLEWAFGGMFIHQNAIDNDDEFLQKQQYKGRTAKRCGWEESDMTSNQSTGSVCSKSGCCSSLEFEKHNMYPIHMYSKSRPV